MNGHGKNLKLSQGYPPDFGVGMCRSWVKNRAVFLKRFRARLSEMVVGMEVKDLLAKPIVDRWDDADIMAVLQSLE